MSKNAKKRPTAGVNSVTLAQRIEELRGRAPVYVSHGEALMLQGMANASFRVQCLTEERIRLED
ncbi:MULTISPECIES: hypothetical protein [unclassified Ruegeria]|uniref:hypothetical protein n=1 Tax=unclassified Ruegeria TaxID=2625375 RepID=UPI00148903AC|nr:MULTISPECIES: hypothetical protein [unclassified Ruegeria]NOD33523.1 hypothetical protein [Ruegeria sp. HKCCD7296]NOD46178.1 hypothetical protein [Ruegeria sp. HKCCD5849]NOD50522.1 hypothetical protein [Ruegeria sp. HKCCD5851]NOE32924.1 hypothetical protein [Ruegeria sp. HKCCD7318]NOE40802.1 hypothetical protein [Ruegeria sp. HKCCD7319]